MGGLNFGPVVLGGESTQAQTREALTLFLRNFWMVSHIRVCRILSVQPSFSCTRGYYIVRDTFQCRIFRSQWFSERVS